MGAIDDTQVRAEHPAGSDANADLTGVGLSVFTFGLLQRRAGLLDQ